jgi:hypothetical protein
LPGGAVKESTKTRCKQELKVDTGDPKAIFHASEANEFKFKQHQDHKASTKEAARDKQPSGQPR